MPAAVSARLHFTAKPTQVYSLDKLERGENILETQWGEDTRNPVVTEQGACSRGGTCAGTAVPDDGSIDRLRAGSFLRRRSRCIIIDTNEEGNIGRLARLISLLNSASPARSSSGSSRPLHPSFLTGTFRNRCCVRNCTQASFSFKFYQEMHRGLLGFRVIWVGPYRGVHHSRSLTLDMQTW